MNKKTLLIPLVLAIILGSVVVPVYAKTYFYNTLYVGKDSNGDPIFKAITNDTDFIGVGMVGGKVRFWLRNGTECPPPMNYMSPFVDLIFEGADLVAYFTFVGYGDAVITVRAHFQGEVYSMWGDCITIPWFTSLPVALLGCVGIIGYLKKKKIISL